MEVLQRFKPDWKYLQNDCEIVHGTSSNYQNVWRNVEPIAVGEVLGNAT